MVPVLDNNKLPLMPCSEKRARQMMTKDEYEQLIDEDLAWLERMPRSLERQHIMRVLLASVEYEYPSQKDSDGRKY